MSNRLCQSRPAPGPGCQRCCADNSLRCDLYKYPLVTAARHVARRGSCDGAPFRNLARGGDLGDGPGAIARRRAARIGPPTRRPAAMSMGWAVMLDGVGQSCGCQHSEATRLCSRILSICVPHCTDVRRTIPSACDHLLSR